MKENIIGKSILLIIEPFFGYGEIIEEELLKLGARSVYRKESEFLPAGIRDGFSLKNILKWLCNPYGREKWTKNLIIEIEHLQFDTLFVVENFPFKKYFLKYLKKKNPKIRMILFLWDTFKTQQPHYNDYLPLFDCCYSFDRDDARKYGLHYFPNFYIEKQIPSISLCKYDIAFIGTMNRNNTRFRGRVLCKIHDFCLNNELKTFFYLYYPIINNSNSFFKRLYHKIHDYEYNKEIEKLCEIGFIHSNPIPIDEYNEVMASTRVVLDLSHRNRQGMTINAIAAIANGKKLITTNKRIKEEPFYDPSAIYIIDEENPFFDMSFVKQPYTPQDFSFLRMDNWLKHVINEEV